MGAAQVAEAGRGVHGDVDQGHFEGRQVHVRDSDDAVSSSGSDSSVAIHNAIQEARSVVAQCFGTGSSKSRAGSGATAITSSSRHSRGVSSADQSSRLPTATSSPHQQASPLEVVGLQHRLRKASALPGNGSGLGLPTVVPSAPFDAAVSNEAANRHCRVSSNTAGNQTSTSGHAHGAGSSGASLGGAGHPTAVTTADSSLRGGRDGSRLPSAQPHVAPATALQQWLDSQRPTSFGGSNQQL